MLTNSERRSPEAAVGLYKSYLEGPFIFNMFRIAPKLGRVSRAPGQMGKATFTPGSPPLPLTKQIHKHFDI